MSACLQIVLQRISKPLIQPNPPATQPASKIFKIKFSLTLIFGGQSVSHHIDHMIPQPYMCLLSYWPHPFKKLGCVSIIQKLQTQPSAKGKSISPVLTIHPDPRYPPPYDLTIPQGLPPPLPDSNSYFPPDLTAAKKFSFYFSKAAGTGRLPLEMFYLSSIFPLPPASPPLFKHNLLCQISFNSLD